MISVDSTDLLEALFRLGTPAAGELAQVLGWTRPRLARQVAAAGEAVLRMGHARATRYARTRSLAGLGTRLPVSRITPEGTVETGPALHLLQGGRHWLETPAGGHLYAGLPPFAVDMSPQGYLGRDFGTRYPELGLPPRLTDWNDDHRLMALARRGEDAPGDVIVGDESLNRFLALTSTPALRSDLPGWAIDSLRGGAGSSVGGEHPKLLALLEGRHVVLKFAGPDSGVAVRRWWDLLWSEQRALEAVAAAGLAAPRVRCFDEGGHRFLEVERFDRIGLRGRRGVVSLGAYDNEYLGLAGSWSALSRIMHERGALSAEDDRAIRWLEAFGQLIGNTDRHSGNLSFFCDAWSTHRHAQTRLPVLTLAPSYDMLPMVFAPVGAELVERPFEPPPPTSETLDVWHDAAEHAERYWERLSGDAALSERFRGLARAARDAVAALRERIPPARAPSP